MIPVRRRMFWRSNINEDNKKAGSERHRFSFTTRVHFTTSVPSGEGDKGDGHFAVKETDTKWE